MRTKKISVTLNKVNLLIVKNLKIILIRTDELNKFSVSGVYIYIYI